jgi:hypothetical protein
MIGTSSPEKDSEYPTQEEIDYEDMVWLTKKSVREKLDKWRKEPTKSEEKSQDKDESPLEKTCYNCYFCSNKRVVNKVQYVRCSFKDPQWVVSQKDLSCWKPRD